MSYLQINYFINEPININSGKINRLNNYKRYLIALSAYKSGGGHIPSCYSCIDLISSIYKDYIIKSDKFDFVLSKGHAALALYSVLSSYSLIDKNELLM